MHDDWDDVIVICGYAGTGKSNLGLWLVERWLKKIYPDLQSSDAEKYVSLDPRQFAKNFAALNRYDASVNDEAGELSGRNSASKLNKLYMKAYQIVRGANLLTVLILPELWDLDPYFRKNRVRHFFLVYKRGRCAFWTHRRYRRMLEINEKLPYRNYFAVEPDYIDKFPKYNGIFADEYKRMKEAKLVGVREELANMIAELQDDPKEERDRMVAELLSKGIPVKQIAERIGISAPTIRAIKEKRFKKYPRKKYTRQKRPADDEI